jgi:hypothetical protein
LQSTVFTLALRIISISQSPLFFVIGVLGIHHRHNS